MTSSKSATLAGSPGRLLAGSRRKRKQAKAVRGGGAAAQRPKLVLGSSSPRRLALLQQAGVEPDALRPVTIDETPKKGEVPRALVRRLAREKALATHHLIEREEEFAGAVVLAADTVVAVGRRIISKTELLDEAATALQLLSGRSHRVYTAVCLVRPDGQIRGGVVETRIRFKRLSHEEIESYLASGEWRGKAGGYAIQGIAAAFVRKLVGSYTNVVGLPLTEVVQLLQGEGYPVLFGWLNKAEVEVA